MREDQPRRVQKLSSRWKRHEPSGSAAAVRVVAHYRMADRREVDANLMRATRVQVRAQKIRRVEPSKPHEVRPRSSPSTDDCHTLSVSRVTSDRTVDCQTVLIEMPPREHRVSADDPSRRNRSAERPVRSIGFGDEQQTRRVLVEPMDQTFAPGAAAFCQRTTASHERINERSAPVTRRGMHDHAGRLVHGEHIVILKYYIELNGFR